MADLLSCIAPGAAESGMAPLRDVLAFAQRHRYDAHHAAHVTGLAMSLFEQLGSLHGYDGWEQGVLRSASLLHDIGWIDGGHRHHKRACEMILAATDLPFTPREQQVLALVARYHRKALPATRHAAYAALPAGDRRRVRVLGGILRVADGLDRRHLSVIRSVHCVVSDDRIHLRCDSSAAAQPERDSALAKGELLELAFRRRLTLTIVRRKTATSDVTSPGDGSNGGERRMRSRP